MIQPPDCVKRYQAAKQRFFKPVLMNFFAQECPRFFGPVMREKITDELIRLFTALSPDAGHLKPGQILWNALDKNTRGDSPRRRFVPVILSVITEHDVERLIQGTRFSNVADSALARMIHEAYAQGGILSTRDLGLITLRGHGWASQHRRRYETLHACTLPHTGALHDMGSTVSHKTLILRKVILEKKDPALVARECQHSQAAVDRYLTDYQRVKSLYRLRYKVEFIHRVTQIAKHVIIQYIAIINHEKRS